MTVNKTIRKPTHLIDKKSPFGLPTGSCGGGPQIHFRHFSSPDVPGTPLGRPWKPNWSQDLPRKLLGPLPGLSFFGFLHHLGTPMLVYGYVSVCVGLVEGTCLLSICTLHLYLFREDFVLSIFVQERPCANHPYLMTCVRFLGLQQIDIYVLFLFWPIIQPVTRHQWVCMSVEGRTGISKSTSHQCLPAARWVSGQCPSNKKKQSCISISTLFACPCRAFAFPEATSAALWHCFVALKACRALRSLKLSF